MLQSHAVYCDTDAAPSQAQEQAQEQRKWEAIRKTLQDRSQDHEGFFAVSRTHAPNLTHSLSLLQHTLLKRWTMLCTPHYIASSYT